MTLQENLERLLKNRTETQLAEELGVSQQFIANLRHGSSTAEQLWSLFNKMRLMPEIRIKAILDRPEEEI